MTERGEPKKGLIPSGLQWKAVSVGYRACPAVNTLYCAFIGKVREYEKEGNSLEEAIRKAVIYCRDHDILKEFLEKNALEVINMLMTEWNWDDALAVRYEEGLEDGMEKGLEEGLEKTARNALAEGLPIEFVRKITGLDMETIKALKIGSNAS